MTPELERCAPGDRQPGRRRDRARSLPLAGATPNPRGARHVVGKPPDGSRVVADAAFFVKGLTLYQATVLGSDEVPGREAVDTFFGAIRLP